MVGSGQPYNITLLLVLACFDDVLFFLSLPVVVDDGMVVEVVLWLPCVFRGRVILPAHLVIALAVCIQVIGDLLDLKRVLRSGPNDTPILDISVNHSISESPSNVIDVQKKLLNLTRIHVLEMEK
jgi:hypothetical protein